MAGQIKKILSEGLREIIYVSIGILIALQINNRNDKRKGQHELENIISIVKHDLTLNVTEAKAIVQNIELKNQYLGTIFDTAISADSIRNCKLCFVINTSFGDMTIRDRGLNMLRNFRANNHTASDSTILFIDAFYAVFIKNNETLTKVLNDDVVGTVNYYRDNFDWYEQYLNGDVTGEMIDDILSNKVTRNRLLHHKLLIDKNYGMMLKAFVSAGEKLIGDLDQRIED